MTSKDKIIQLLYDFIFSFYLVWDKLSFLIPKGVIVNHRSVLNKQITKKEIISSRPEKSYVDLHRPYFWLHEQEMQEDGVIRSVNTIFLTNNECPFTCLMCDLWRKTLDAPTPEGAIPEQVSFALERLPKASVIKLYNSGNFFDGKAIPRTDYQKIALLLREYEHVIVENHPKLINPFISEFNAMLNGSLEIAMGLETIHPDVLPRLNKQFNLCDFERATTFFTKNNISSRAFLLLNPPFLTDENENYEWCLKSVQYAFQQGIAACTIIPTRTGNGIMKKLQKAGDYIPPTIESLERVFNDALIVGGGRIFCDTWDLETFSSCEKCLLERKKRLEQMNLNQKVLPDVNCSCNRQGSNDERTTL